MNIIDLEKELENYIKENKRLELSTTTIKNYKTTIIRFIKYLKNEKIREINQDNICQILKDYDTFLIDKNNKTSTRIRYLTDIIIFINKIETEKFKIDPQKILPINKSKNKKPKYLEMEEIQEIINYIPPSRVRDKAIIQTLFRTGLRISELSNLTKNDLDLKSTDPVIALNIVNGKGGKDRTVYIDQDTLKLLNKMVYKRTRKNKKDKNNDYLFTARTGNQLKNSDIQKIVKKHAQSTDKINLKKGIKTNYKDKLTPHTLRHSFTIYLLNEAEKPINEVQALLGHSNLATTSVYAQIDNKTIKKSYETIQWDKQ